MNRNRCFALVAILLFCVSETAEGQLLRRNQPGWRAQRNCNPVCTPVNRACPTNCQTVAVPAPSCYQPMVVASRTGACCQTTLTAPGMAYLTPGSNCNLCQPSFVPMNPSAMAMCPSPVPSLCLQPNRGLQSYTGVPVTSAFDDCVDQCKTDFDCEEGRPMIPDCAEACFRIHIEGRPTQMPVTPCIEDPQGGGN